MIPPTQGVRSFDKNRGIFDIRHQREREATIFRPTGPGIIDAHMLIAPADDATMISAMQREPDSLALTEDQIVTFCEQNLVFLGGRQYQMNVFIFKAGERLFAAQINLTGDLWRCYTQPLFGYYTGTWNTDLNINLLTPRQS